MFSHETLNDQGRTVSAELGRRIRNSSSQSYQSPKRSLRDEAEADLDEEDVDEVEVEPHDRLDTDEEQELEYVLKGTVEVSDSEEVHDAESAETQDQSSATAVEGNKEGKRSDAAETPVSGDDQSNCASSEDDGSQSELKEEFPEANGEGGVEETSSDNKSSDGATPAAANSSRKANDSAGKADDRKSPTEEV